MNTQEIIDFQRCKYQDLCLEMKELLSEEKERAAKKSEIRSQIIEMAGCNRMEYGIKLQSITSKGTIDYPKFVKDCKVEESTLEFYRKPERTCWKVSSY